MAGWKNGRAGHGTKSMTGDHSGASFPTVILDSLRLCTAQVEPIMLGILPCFARDSSLRINVREAGNGRFTGGDDPASHQITYHASSILDRERT